MSDWVKKIKTQTQTQIHDAYKKLIKIQLCINVENKFIGKKTPGECKQKESRSVKIKGIFT